MICKDCGEQMEGDGYTLAIHCPNVEDITECTPDCNPIHCNDKVAVRYKACVNFDRILKGNANVFKN